MSSTDIRQQTTPQVLKHDGTRRFICQTSDQHFVPASENEIVVACFQSGRSLAALEERYTAFEIAMKRLQAWAKASGRIDVGVVSAAEREYSVVFVATDEDERGDLHDAMTNVEIELNKACSNLCFFDLMLLRSKEAKGIFSLVNPAKAMLFFQRAQ